MPWPRLILILTALMPAAASAQTLSQRGFVEARGLFFPQQAPNDPTQAVGDLLVREELFVKPVRWLRLAGGVDLRASSQDQIEDSWHVDLGDRGLERPRASVRRASVTIVRGTLTVDLGKQFIRWGKADIVNPTDRFAPRDFLNVVDPEFLAVAGARAVVQAGEHDTMDVVWLPGFTPSRIPLLNQRWTAVPAPEIRIVDAGSTLPRGTQVGLRWSRIGTRLEWSLSFVDGFNHLPIIDARVRPAFSAAGEEIPPGSLIPEVEIERVHPPFRSVGADAALPTAWFTLKAEAAYFASSSPVADEYVLYVVQLERQTGEWIIIIGYAGEVVTDHRATLTFAPDRGLTRSAVGRASYTIDPNRSLAFETAIRQNLSGAYFKAEYSQAYGQHWRATITSALIRGEADDFLGQYRLNSHVSLVLRYSF